MSDIVTWAESNWCPPSEGGRPIVFEPHQRRILEHVFSRDGEGRFPYQTILWSEPKKSGKTELAAQVSYWLAREEGPYSEVYMLANDLEQAKSRGFQALTRAVRRFKGLRVQADRVLLPHGSVVQAVASEYAGAAGANPTCSTWDELWAYTSENSRRLWEELTPVPTRRNSLRFIVTYAGFEGESTLLEELYKRGLEGEPVPGLEDLDDGDGAPACRRANGLFMFWSHKPRMPWQTPRYYEAQRAAPGFRPNAFLRLHENRWVGSESQFIDMAAWDACVEPGMAPLAPTKDIPLYAGVDAATKRDCCAAVACYWDGEAGKVRLAAHRIWTPTKREPVDLEETVERWLRQLARDYSVWEVVFDPFQLARSAQTLRRAGLPMREFPQTVPNLTQATQALFDAVNFGQLAVYNAPDLREHLASAVAVESAHGLKLAKERSGRKIDGAVALSFAVLRARGLGSAIPTGPIPGPVGVPQDPDGWSEGGRSRWSSGPTLVRRRWPR